MRVFLTGATGVVGRRLVPLLVQAGHDVTAMARTVEKAERLRAAGATPAVLDLFDAEAVARAVAGHGVVVNMATHIPATSAAMMRPGAWKENDRIRCEGSRILVDAALAGGVRRFVQESYAPIYEARGDRWIDETVPFKPSRYNLSTQDAEASAQRFTAAGGEGVILRFGGFYGPESAQCADIVKFVRKGWFPLLGRPEAYWSSITLDDAATAALAALSVPAGIYNAADDEPVTRAELARVLADALGVDRPKHFPAWTSRLLGSVGEMMSRSLRISNRKLRDASGWAPTYPSVREGWPAVIRQMGG